MEKGIQLILDKINLESNLKSKIILARSVATHALQELDIFFYGNDNSSCNNFKL